MLGPKSKQLKARKKTKALTVNATSTAAKQDKPARGLTELQHFRSLMAGSPLSQKPVFLQQSRQTEARPSTSPRQRWSYVQKVKTQERSAAAIDLSSGSDSEDLPEYTEASLGCRRLGDSEKLPSRASMTDTEAGSAMEEPEQTAQQRWGHPLRARSHAVPKEPCSCPLSTTSSDTSSAGRASPRLQSSQQGGASEAKQPIAKRVGKRLYKHT